jgi:predicted GIY-YIG superfamily endonuclease
MPKNYNQARIYKITCNLPTINEIYIGSTADYEQRCINHYSDCNNVNSPNYGYKVYNYIRNNGNFGNFTIDVIEHYPCANKTEMRIREQYYINAFKPTLNTNRAYRTEEELKEYNNEYSNQYRNDNPEYFKQYQNQYRQQYPEYFKQNNNNRPKGKFNCSNCDKTYTYTNKKTHLKSKYCKNYKSTASESSTESIINSDTDVE